MNAYFITGTDTDVGKTLSAAAITLALKAYYWKPVSSGGLDHERVQSITGLSDAHFHPTNYAFKASLSPDQAAALEGITIDINTCKLPQTKQTLIVEGAGGVYAPLTQEICMLDLMRYLALPVIIVSRGTLGTINHTLLTIEALRNRQISIKGVIFNGDLNPDNQVAIEKWGQVKTLFHIPYFKALTQDTFKTWVTAQQDKIQEVLS